MRRDKPILLAEVPVHILVEATKETQYVTCTRCNDFVMLPWSMADTAWLRAFRDFVFEHDTCPERRDSSVKKEEG